MPANKVHGFDLLLRQVIDSIEDNYADMCQDAPGDSPIEKLFALALTMRAQHGATEYADVVFVETEQDEKDQLEIDDRSPIRLVVRPQVTIGNRRVDFLIHALDWSSGFKNKQNWKWRKLIVECDGHDYHERTKQQAAKDRAKDRAAVMQGHDCFRFTGSELWADPWGCVEQVTDWAFKGWYLAK